VGYGKAGTARESQFGIIDEQKNWFKNFRKGICRANISRFAQDITCTYLSSLDRWFSLASSCFPKTIKDNLCLQANLLDVLILKSKGKKTQPQKIKTKQEIFELFSDCLCTSILQLFFPFPMQNGSPFLLVW
jgi:hypothetical protein